MKRITFVTIALFCIVATALLLRTARITTNPPSISWDEASIGYNAYSILMSGKDEHGKRLPLDAFAAFGDYKPPLPIYITVPFVAVFGLGELSVRLPSALAGTLTVLLMYFLITELFTASKYARELGLTGASILAITPWHIMLSRAGFEANIAVLFITFGVWCVLKAREHSRYFLVCWLPFVLGVYTFNSARYAGPLLAVGLIIFVWKHVVRFWKKFLIGILIGLVALAPILPHLLSKQARLRFDEVSIFTDLNIVLTANARRQSDGFTWWSGILDNRRISYVHTYLVHFFDNIQPRFLFIYGDGNPKFSIQDTGELLLISAPLLAYGLLQLFIDYPAVALLLVWWLIASIAPAAVARETPHALRIENGLPVYIIVTAFGFVSTMTRLKSRRFRVIFLSFTVFLFFCNLLYFWHNLMAHYPKEYSGEWQYGYKQAILYTDTVKMNYDTIVFSENIGRPYIYLLFYDRVNPNEFWKKHDASFDPAGFYNVYGFGKYRFVTDRVSIYPGKTLYVLPPKQVPSDAHILKTISVLNGTPILVIFD